MSPVKVFCYRCGAAFEFDPPLSRNAVCESCNAYLHCCKNCRFYDQLAPNECQEPQAENVRDKEAANFCDFFEPAPSRVSSAGSDRAAEARRKLEELFRKSRGN